MDLSGVPQTVYRTSQMRASLTAAAAAFITILTAGGAEVAAQAFDTSPQYDAYAPGQRVPQVNLPRTPSPGTSLRPTSTERMESLPTTRSSSETSTPAVPARRADAGALRPDMNANGKAGAASTEKTGVPPAPASDQQKYPAGTVLEGTASVYDGQNIILQGAPVRFDGAEAPALAQQCSTRQGLVWNCGGRAAERLRELVSQGRIRCVVTEPLGSGAAAICSARGVSDIGATMISEGLAVSNGHDKGRYAMQQAMARASSRGMWIGPFEAPWTWRARHGQ